MYCVEINTNRGFPLSTHDILPCGSANLLIVNCVGNCELGLTLLEPTSYFTQI